MTRPVVVGVDGSLESLAAAEWAGTEADLRDAPLRLVHGQAHTPHGPRYSQRRAAAAHATSPEEAFQAARERVSTLYPSLEITDLVASGSPPRVLLDAAQEADMLVVGSRGLGTVKGFMLGSVGLSVVAHTTVPVVVFHGDGRTPSDADESSRVVAGVDLNHHYEAVLHFAFEAAARQSVVLRVAHAWSVQSLYAYPSALPDPRVVAERGEVAARALTDALRPWRDKYPSVEVEESSAPESAAPHLLEAGAGAALLVVGRRTHGHPPFTPIGPVTHAVLHHADNPVAVIPHE